MSLYYREGEDDDEAEIRFAEEIAEHEAALRRDEEDARARDEEDPAVEDDD